MPHLSLDEGFVLFKKFLRFLGGGGLVWAGCAIFTAIGTEVFYQDPVLIYRIGLALSFIFNCIINLRFTFRVYDRVIWRLFKYTGVSASFQVLNGWLMGWLYGWGLHYFFALSVSTGALLVLKFFVFNYLVFQTAKPFPAPEKSQDERLSG